jgi:hypothetical protein
LAIRAGSFSASPSLSVAKVVRGRLNAGGDDLFHVATRLKANRSYDF